jgi:hypothetical protein
MIVWELVHLCIVHSNEEIGGVKDKEYAVDPVPELREVFKA